jgi:Cu+-exporting ATPase
MQTIRLSISGMSCAGCVASVEAALNDIAGVTSAQVNFAEHAATVEGDVAVETLQKAVDAAGFRAAELRGVEDELEKEKAENEHYRGLLKKTAVAALVGFPLMILGMSGVLPEMTTQGGRLIWFAIGLVTLAAMVYSGRHFFTGALSAARHHSATMDTLVALGTGTAWLYSMVIVAFPELVPDVAQHAYFEASAIIIALINFGSALETRARSKTSEAIKRLIGLQPRTARVIRDGVEQDIDISEVGLDESLRVRPGERIPVDGVIIDGHSTIDESMLTGEPVPVKRQAGDEVFTGTINRMGSFIFKANRIGKDTTLSQIIEMVRRAQASKPAIGRLADRVSSVFVPGVMIIAVLTFLAWFNFGPPEQAIPLAIVTTMTVLIIACPCALGLATPISIMVAVGKAAEFGALIRNGDALQQAGRLDTIVLDKTGTVTEGKPSVTELIPAAGWTRERLLQYAGSIEQGSEHPLAEAIVEAAKKGDMQLLTAERFNAIAGHGVEAQINAQTVLLGNQRLMRDHGIDLSEVEKDASDLMQNAHTPVYLSVDNKLAGMIGVADAIKQDSEAAIKRMLALGLRVVLLTGDREETAQVVARQLGISEVIAEVLPQDKAEQIARLQSKGSRVGMVGDGINDAPALARADVGFAIGTGTDVAIESADITLMRGSLLGIVDVIELSLSTVRNIKQNLFGAFIYNSLGIPVAAGILFPLTGLLLSPMIAGAAMAMSSVTVVSNANRLRLFKPRG